VREVDSVGSLMCSAAFTVALVATLLPGWSRAGFLSDSDRVRLLATPTIDRPVVDAFAFRDRVEVFVFLGGTNHGERIDTMIRGVPTVDLEQLHSYQSIPAFTARVTSRGLARLLDREESLRVSLEVEITSQLAQAIPLVGMDQLHATGLTGSGVRIAVLDTGIDTDHPDLEDAILDERCFCEGAAGPSGCCPNGFETQSGPQSAEDDHGHGTRMSGVLTSAGLVAPIGGAPDAKLIPVKVLPASGPGSGGDLVAALDWILSERPDITVVNLSLGGGLYAGDCDDADAFTLALAAAIDGLYDRGTLVVAGAGNNGSGTAMIAPACIMRAISVGAVWDDFVGSRTYFGCTDATTAPDQVACWSNSSATTDVFAPGGMMGTSTLGGGLAHHAGTSYATPVVAACAALLQAEFAGASAAQITTAVTTSPVLVVDDTNGLAFPRLDCPAAVQALAPPVPLLPDGGWRLAAALLVAAAFITSLRRREQRTARPPTCE
jgi:subtilisin family serine protease